MVCNLANGSSFSLASLLSSLKSMHIWLSYCKVRYGVNLQLTPSSATSAHMLSSQCERMRLFTAGQGVSHCAIEHDCGVHCRVPAMHLFPHVFFLFGLSGLGNGFSYPAFVWSGYTSNCSLSCCWDHGDQDNFREVVNDSIFDCFISFEHISHSPQENTKSTCWRLQQSKVFWGEFFDRIKALKSKRQLLKMNSKPHTSFEAVGQAKKMS